MGPMRGRGVLIGLTLWLISVGISDCYLFPSGIFSRQENVDGLYVSNGTHILHTKDGEIQRVLVERPRGRIVGLAIDYHDKILFWSDVSVETNGIWRCDLADGFQQRKLTNTKRDVNGLSVDWVSKHVYWTDQDRRTVEISDYNGRNRRILISSGLRRPRGVLVDPINGYLFWNDQAHHHVERSKLDGSHRLIIVTNHTTFWPNQMALLPDQRIGWVDGWHRTMFSCDPDGNHVTAKDVSKETSHQPIFGIAASHSGNTFISDWTGRVLSIISNSNQTVSEYGQFGSRVMYGLVYADEQFQQQVAGPCSGEDKGGCSHICLPTTAPLYRCSCPTYGGLALAPDGKQCQEPEQILLYASAGSGDIGFRWLNGASTPDTYLIGHSYRPVAVGYDPIDKVVYWSDVLSHAIYRAPLDGSTEKEVFLNSTHGIGIVDGLAVDWKNRRLYFSNMGTIRLHSMSHSWHRLEMVSLTGKERRIIKESGDHPRSVWIDMENNYLYFSEWGRNASVVRSFLDGSSARIIQHNLDNPNSIVVEDGSIYVVDSHAKARQDGKTSRQGGLYTGRLGAQWSEIQDIGLELPFGLAKEGSRLFISDWTTDSIVSYDLQDSRQSKVRPFLENVPDPMGLFYTPTTMSRQDAVPCVKTGCKGLCMQGSPTAGNSCRCNSYKGRILHQENGVSICKAPERFLLFADMNTIKMYGLGSATDREIHTVVQSDSYKSNIVALAYHPTTNTVYFTDVSHLKIYKANIGGGRSGKIEEFFNAKHHIDGLALDLLGNRLYWTEYDTGNISSIALSGHWTTHRTLVSGLDHPRAIVLDSSHKKMYWSEWGRVPRIVRADLNGENRREILNSGLRWPNGLAIDVARQRLYVADGRHARILQIDLQAYLRPPVNLTPRMSERPQHAFGLAKLENFIFYSDWHKKSISMFNLDNNNSVTITKNLMRPTEIILHHPGDLEGCPGDHGCSDRCISTPHGHECQCNSTENNVRFLKADLKTCQHVDAWVEVHMSKCPQSCRHLQNTVCTEHVLTKVIKCQCKPGYYGDRCLACPVDTFKPAPGPDVCRRCPRSKLGQEGSTAGGIGQAECRCPLGMKWVREGMECYNILDVPHKDGYTQCYYREPHGYATLLCENAQCSLACEVGQPNEKYQHTYTCDITDNSGLKWFPEFHDNFIHDACN